MYSRFTFLVDDYTGVLAFVNNNNNNSTTNRTDANYFQNGRCDWMDMAFVLALVVTTTLIHQISWNCIREYVVPMYNIYLFYLGDVAFAYAEFY